MRNTSTVSTPAPPFASKPDNNVLEGVSASLVVQTGRPVPWGPKDVDAVKRYASNFKSIVKVRGCDINFFPAGEPETVNFLYGKGQCETICDYTPEGMYNAYYALVMLCDSDANIFLEKFKSGVLSRYDNFYNIKQSSKQTTPPLRLPFV